MNVSADQVRAATRAAAAVITPDSVPPLRADESPGLVRPGRRSRVAWFVPLAAAAAVVAVVLGGTAAGSWLAAKHGDGQSGVGAVKPATPVGAATIAGSVPAHYVEIGAHSYAFVRATTTGATLATITTRTPFVGVAGAADDRTFVLDAQRSVMGPIVEWVGQPELYLLRLSASGTEQSLSRVTLPSLPKGTPVTGLAFSPDGGTLAVAVAPGGNRLGRQEIIISTLATGSVRSWSSTGSYDGEDPNGFTGSGVDASESISWTADGKTLAFDWSDQSRQVIGVRLLDTAAGGHNLIADSRLAVIEGPGNPRPAPHSKDNVSQCVTNAIITADGSSIICGYTTTVLSANNSASSTTGLLQYSTETGKITRVFGVFQFAGQAAGDISLYWTGVAGKTAIGGILTPSGIRVGVVSGKTFAPLPGVTGLGGAAW